MGLLHTIDILHTFQIILSLICTLYGLQVKTHDHLFFQCPFFCSNLGCYHEHDPSKLAFYDLTTFASVGKHKLEKKKSICIYLLGWSSQPQFTSFGIRGITEFFISYRSHQDVCEEIFYLVRYCLVEFELRYQILAALRSI